MACKYANNYAGIAELEKGDAEVERTAGFEALDLNSLPPNTGFRKLKSRLVSSFLRFLGLPLMRGFFPVVRLGGFVWVTRYDDVKAVINAHEAFEVPFGREMKTLTGGYNFALGDDGELHERQRKAILAVWTDYDLDALVLAPARETALALLNDSGGEIDAVRDIFTRVATEICLSLYGIKADDADEFADCCMAGTAMLFADPDGDVAARRQALIGSRRLRHVIDANYDRLLVEKGNGDGLLPRLIALSLEQPGSIGEQDANPEQVKGEIRAILFGMITGFVPTNTMAAGHILEELACRPKRFAEACRLAQDAEKNFQSWRSPFGPGEPAAAEKKYKDSFTRLQNYLFEAARFNPALFPGQFRVCRSKDHKVFSENPRLQKIRPGEVVMASTASALMDRRRYPHPLTFDPDRFAGEAAPRDLMFGVGLHDCIGERIAKDLTTQMFLVLLSRENIRFAESLPRLERAGPFPRHMDMRFDMSTGQRQQTMITSVLSIRRDAEVEARKFLRALGEPGETSSESKYQEHKTKLKKAFDASNIVHFASINVIELGDTNAPNPSLLFEFNVDGALEPALERLFRDGVAGECLSPLLEWIEPRRNSAPTIAGMDAKARTATLAKLIRAGVIQFHTRPWGATGLNFTGTGEFPVTQIDAEDKLYRFVTDKLAEIRYQQRDGRRLTERELYDEVKQAVKCNEFLRPLLVRPRTRYPSFTRWVDFSFYGFIAKYLTSNTFLMLYGLFLASTIAVPLILSWLFLAPILPTYVTFWGAPIAGLVTLAILAIAVLRYHELVLEKPHDEQASQQHLREILRMEDLPGHCQNHLTSVTQMKPGLFRKLTMALALYVVKKEVALWFRPGFIIDFNTIHYARWFTVPGSSKLIFQSNYDGSWESYLEDFITKVHAGQTAAWNNGVGFPRTNWLIEDGAKDGDRFKRWVRRQQVETLYWYTRFPLLTTDSIRKNALVREGLARARTVAEHRAWVDLFDAAPRTTDTIETDQVQSLVFGSLGGHSLAACHIIAIEDVDKARTWLGGLVDNAVYAEDPKKSDDLPAALTFGDANPAFGALFVAFSAEGLRKLGLPVERTFDGMNTFPIPFLEGMANRSKILGDLGQSDTPAKWRWMDAAIGEKSSAALPSATAADMILLAYDNTRNGFERTRNSIVDEEKAKANGVRIIQTIDISLAGERSDHREPFGFRDGISQPVIRGTRQFAKGGAMPENIVSPGEFLLGYKDTRGYYPPSLTVLESTDSFGDLPPVQDAMPDRIPQFAHTKLTELRDFGRNGSFLAVRQLAQDVEAFNAYVGEQTKAFQDNRYLAGSRRILNSAVLMTIGGSRTRSDADPSQKKYLEISSREWVAAKLMGRWQDGSSLTRNPVVSQTHQLRNAFLTRLAEKVESLQGGSRDLANLKSNLAIVDPDALIWDEKEWDKLLRIVRQFNQSDPNLRLPLGMLQPVEPDNDFHHGLEDPQGLSCPVTSHIRKANPRDSFRPGSEIQWQINNRHRLLRRGRTYSEGEDRQKAGTFFMCFNANIERQFEFVQQTWLNSRSFHEMRNAPDPIVSPKCPMDQISVPTSDRNFVLPFTRKDKEWKDFVTVVGGGYFFLPSRQALRFLTRPPGWVRKLSSRK